LPSNARNASSLSQLKPEPACNGRVLFCLGGAV
jgi:hypothetical protein